jgi:hypothetical protein
MSHIPDIQKQETGVPPRARPSGAVAAASLLGRQRRERHPDAGTLCHPPVPGHKRGFGGVAEWFKAAVLKTAVRASAPWVRIPVPPPAPRPRPFEIAGKTVAVVAPFSLRLAALPVRSNTLGKGRGDVGSKPPKAAGPTARNVRHAASGPCGDDDGFSLLVRTPDAGFWAFLHPRRHDAGDRSRPYSRRQDRRHMEGSEKGTSALKDSPL